MEIECLQIIERPRLVLISKFHVGIQAAHRFVRHHTEGIVVPATQRGFVELHQIHISPDAQGIVHRVARVDEVDIRFRIRKSPVRLRTENPVHSPDPRVFELGSELRFVGHGNGIVGLLILPPSHIADERRISPDDTLPSQNHRRAVAVVLQKSPVDLHIIRIRNHRIRGIEWVSPRRAAIVVIGQRPGKLPFHHRRKPVPLRRFQTYPRPQRQRE